MSQILKFPVPTIGNSAVNMEMFHDFLLIEPIEKAMTDGGLALPEGATPDDLARGRIVRLGPGRVTEYGTVLPTDFLKIGDVVYMPPPDRALGIKFGSKMYVLTRARELIGKVENKEAELQKLAA